MQNTVPKAMVVVLPEICKISLLKEKENMKRNDNLSFTMGKNKLLLLISETLSKWLFWPKQIK